MERSQANNTKLIKSQSLQWVLTAFWIEQKCYVRNKGAELRINHFNLCTRISIGSILICDSVWFLRHKSKTPYIHISCAKSIRFVSEFILFYFICSCINYNESPVAQSCAIGLNNDSGGCNGAQVVSICLLHDSSQLNFDRQRWKSNRKEIESVDSWHAAQGHFW